MLCCGNSNKDKSPTNMDNKHMKLQQEPSVDNEDHEDEAARSSSSSSAATIPQVPAPTVKMAGYLDKRGKRFMTWKQYWFVLDGRLLLYFRSQFDYLQLSPCRGSLNLGLVSGVRPAGSRSSPQLELLSRSQTMLLRTKERGTQERWLQALLDAMQMHPASGTSTFRYTNASMPKTKTNGAGDNDENVEDDVGIATQNVLQRIKHIGGHSQASLVAELRTVGTGSLRHVATPKTQVRSKSSPQRVAELTAQLPTNKAVLRLLERRQEEDEDQHVTTIVIEPTESKEEIEVNDETPADTNSVLGSSQNSLPQEGTSEIPELSSDIEVMNDGYVATEALLNKEEDTEDGLYEAVPPVEVAPEEDEEVDYDTMGPVEDVVYEPSVPPRRVLEQKEENTKQQEVGKPVTDSKKLQTFTPTSNLIKRKRSFLDRMLGKNKNKKVACKENIKDIPQINIQFAEEEEEDDYETVDYEELIKNRRENEKKEELDNKLDKDTSKEKIDTLDDQSNKAYVNIDIMKTTMPNSEDKIKIELKAETKVINTVTCNTEPVQEITSNIVPIVENEKTHTITITVHNNGDLTNSENGLETEPKSGDESSKPQLPPRRSSSSGSVISPQPRPNSPWHDIPTNNAPVIAKTKRRSSDFIYTATPVSLVADLENEDSEIHRTIINIAGEEQKLELNSLDETTQNGVNQESSKVETSVTSIGQTNQELESQSECDEVLESNKNCGNCLEERLRHDAELINNLHDQRCTHKHHSADELDILLRELANITNSPLHSASVDALGPLRKNRTGCDPDYDVPRPHQLYMTLQRPQGKNAMSKNEEILEATRFFNEPELHYARPLSEYLQELEKMSSMQQKRGARANNAFQKWIEETQVNILNGHSNQDLESLKEVSDFDLVDGLKKDDNTDESQELNEERSKEVSKELASNICENILTINEEKQLISEMSQIENIVEDPEIIAQEEDKHLLKQETNSEKQEEVEVICQEHSLIVNKTSDLEQNIAEEVDKVEKPKLGNLELDCENIDKQENAKKEEITLDNSLNVVKSEPTPPVQNSIDHDQTYDETHAEPEQQLIPSTVEVESTLKSDEIIEQNNNVETAQSVICDSELIICDPKLTEENSAAVTPLVTETVVIKEYDEILEVAESLKMNEECKENTEESCNSSPETHTHVVSDSIEKINFEIATKADLEKVDTPLAFEYLPLSLEPIISPIEIQLPPEYEQTDTTVEMRESKRTENAVRLSYAMSEAEIVEEETVDTIKTPYTSSLFSFPSTEQETAQDTL